MADLSAAPCLVHEMPYCAICAGHDKRQRPRATGATIESRMDGRCSCCGERYEAGTPITYSSDAGGWVLTSHVEGS